VTLGVRLCVCLSAESRLHAALVSAAKVMRCIQFSVVWVFEIYTRDSQQTCARADSPRVKNIDSVKLAGLKNQRTEQGQAESN